MHIISTKYGYIQEMWIISTERGDPQNVDNIRTNRANRGNNAEVIKYQYQNVSLLTLFRSRQETNSHPENLGQMNRGILGTYGNQYCTGTNILSLVQDW